MASVWETHDVVLARSVAVKVLHPHLAADRLFLERFRREAISAARLAHPNVVATYDAGITSEGTAFIVMELIRGSTLAAFAVEHRPLPILMCVEIAKQIADGLAHAHQAGLVHRDIKPANVLVCDADSGILVKVTDFGIAKAAEGLGLELTQTGMVMGTPRYLSPEQVEGREPDARVDLYALGVVLFELVAGMPPFRGPTEMAVAVQHLKATPERLSDLRPGVPASLDLLVDALLAKRPEDRPQTATAVRQALVRIEASGRRAPPPVSNPAAYPLAPIASCPPPPLSAPVAGSTAIGPPARATPPRATMPPPRATTPAAVRGPGANRTTAGGSPAARRSTGPPQSPPGRATPPRAVPRPAPPRRPNWAGRLVAVLVVVALVVVVLVLTNGGSTPHHDPPGAPVANATTPIAIAIPIQNISVFHLERDADHAATVGYADDGNPDTAWTTSVYFTPTFAGLRHGLGLAMTLASSHTLHSLAVLSSTTGWSAEVFVADSVPDPPSLAPWGPPVASQQDINGSTTFSLAGHSGSAILLWITNLGTTDQASIAEVTVR